MKKKPSSALLNTSTILEMSVIPDWFEGISNILNPNLLYHLNCFHDK